MLVRDGCFEEGAAEEAEDRRKFVRRSEIEQRALERKSEEEKRELQEKSNRNGVAGVGDDAVAKSDASSLPAASKASLKARENVGDEERIDEMVLPKVEVIRRLRYLKHPIMLFGEDDDARQSRLKALLKAGITDPDSELMEGQRNDFLVDMAELRKREKHGRLEPRKEKNKEKDGGAVEDGDRDGGGGGEQNVNGDGGISSGVDNDKDIKRLKSNFEELCDEDKILVFFKRLLQEWEQELEDR